MKLEIRKAPGRPPVRTRVRFTDGYWWLDDPEWNRRILLDPLFVSSNWKLKPLSKTLGMGPRTFARLLDVSLGVCGKQWLRELRVTVACRLLRQEGKIESVSRELGFSHPSDFTADFKFMMGLLPSEYRAAEWRRAKDHDGMKREGTTNLANLTNGRWAG